MARAALRRRWRRTRRKQAAGEFLDLIAAPPGWAASWRVSKLARALPGVGEASAAQLRGRLLGDPKLCQLTPNQRERVQGWVEDLWPFAQRGGRCRNCGEYCGWNTRLCFDCRYGRAAAAS